MPILQMFNLASDETKNSSKSSGLSFHQCLAETINENPKSHIKNQDSFINGLSFDVIIDELNQLLSGLPEIEQAILSKCQQEKPSLSFNTLISLIENETSRHFSEAASFDEWFNQVKISPKAVGVLTIVKAFETIEATEANVDFTLYKSMLNNMLEREYPSYINTQPLSSSNLNQAIEQMDLQDKVLIEGQIVLKNWVTSDETGRLHKSEKLIVINNKLAEMKRMPIVDAEMKKEILHEILSSTTNLESKNSLQHIIGNADLSLIKTIFHNTVNSLFTENTLYSQLDSFVNKTQSMSVVGEIFLGNSISNDRQDPLFNKPIQFEKKERFLYSINKEQTEQSEALKKIEETIYLLQSELNQLPEVSKNSSNFIIEVVNLINQYIGNNHDQGIDNNASIKNIQSDLFIRFPGKTQSILSLLNMKDMNRSPYFMNITEPHYEFNANELTQKMDPFMKRVEMLMKEMDIPSTQGDLNDLVKKVESAIKVLQFEYQQLEQKGFIPKDIHIFNESLKTKLTKDHEQSIVKNESSAVKEYEPFIGKTINGRADQLLPALKLPIQANEAEQTGQLKAETFTIQLDMVLDKLDISPSGKETDRSTRQEFTKQLVNAFKTSKFAQLPNGANRLLIKLNPEHLGSLTVRLVQRNGEMIARIITSTESARDLLDHTLNQLKQALPTVQIEIERFELFTEQNVRPSKEHNSEQKQEKEYAEQKRDEEDKEHEKSFIESLKEVLNATV
ncbi:flagellar hook-length control protein FliK [uncultured Metabacillus sp.]|uniref:flagellar hook-length control protein FliK n=1 Tax=uncultured Metabacillus sp. TaxID=2860135 RepID=UPI0026098353|nr:flagellar hook-length control protein FliK [uncultured Metabacillus sp.]